VHLESDVEPLANAGVNSILHDSQHPSTLVVGTKFGELASYPPSSGDVSEHVDRARSSSRMT